MGRKSKGNKAKAEAMRPSKAPKRNNQSTTTSSAITPLPSTPINVYTLADEARNTSQHDHSIWSQSTLLRKKPVLFVSAGLIEPLKSPEDKPRTEPNEQESSGTASSQRIEKPKKHNTAKEEPQSHAKIDGDTATNDESATFFFDVSKPSGDASKSATTAAAAPSIELRRSPSISSDSSEEIIIFQGRRNKAAGPRDQMNLASIKIELSAVESEIALPVTDDRHKADTANDKPRQDVKDETPRNTQSHPARSRGRRSGQRVRERRQANDENDDLLIADYIDNMQNNGELDDFTAYIENLQARQRASDELSEDSDAGESSNDEIDDETLRRLIAGQDLDDQDDKEDAAESSSSTDDGTDVNFLAGLESYGQFDPMDWERPSVRRKRGKGGKARLDLNLENIDSDMERTLQAAWRTDRQKKSDRKRLRQEMRARGLLGKKANPDDTRVKYPAGMTTDQVADEFRLFLIGDAPSLSLPPMDKHCRKMVHELANKFNVKSKSIGKGDQRRPILYRTRTTASFKEHAFDQAVNRMTRRYFPRLDQKGKKSGEPFSRSYAATSYRDGDVVGAAAPEIGVENRGRAMLEKMGWSRGTALGTDDNKGILQPVIQTMKKTKAGLG